LVLNFTSVIKIKQIQFLSHQSKISSKIELFTYLPEDGLPRQDINHNEFRRLGYLSLDTNTRSNFEAREFKSVYVNIDSMYLKIVLNECHKNKFNAFSQVGLIAINVLGD
jgi:centrosomal protein CEP104